MTPLHIFTFVISFQPLHTCRWGSTGSTSLSSYFKEDANHWKPKMNRLWRQILNSQWQYCAFSKNQSGFVIDRPVVFLICEDSILWEINKKAAKHPLLRHLCFLFPLEGITWIDIHSIGRSSDSNTPSKSELIMKILHDTRGNAGQLNTQLATSYFYICIVDLVSLKVCSFLQYDLWIPA